MVDRRKWRIGYGAMNHQLQIQEPGSPANTICQNLTCSISIRLQVHRPVKLLPPNDDRSQHAVAVEHQLNSDPPMSWRRHGTGRWIDLDPPQPNHKTIALKIEFEGGILNLHRV